MHGRTCAGEARELKDPIEAQRAADEILRAG